VGEDRQWRVAPGETDEALDYFDRAGLRLFYLPQWMWQGPGLYQVKRSAWPEGIVSLRAFSDRLRRKGILLGIHTGSAGIFMRDRMYASPKPDDRLATWGDGALAKEIGDKDRTILFRPAAGVKAPVINKSHTPFTRPPVFPLHWSANWIRIGDEIIQVGSFENTDRDVWKLVGCRRGANRTKVSSHPADAGVRGMLVTYGSCFTPRVGSTLFDEATANMARLVNEARLARISYDALEFSDYSGYWGSNKFIFDSYMKFDHAVACETSNGAPQFQWHMCSYKNVGEGMHVLPKGYFEGYLARNCQLSNNDFLPGALGAFTFRSANPSHLASSPDEWEWLLSKAAGYDACFFLETSMKYFRANGQTVQILKLVKAWEDARIARSFTPEQRRMLRDYDMSFRLTGTGRKWSVRPVKIQTRYPLADGKAVGFENPFANQPLQFEARVLPAFAYAGPGNIPLLPADLGRLKIDPALKVRSVDGSRIRGGEGADGKVESKDITIEEYLSIMGTGSTGAGRTASARPSGSAKAASDGADQTLLLSAGNTGKKPSRRAMATWALDPLLDLTAHRGVGMWVTGDGRGGYLYVEVAMGWGAARKYMVANDVKGRRYVEIPCGEIGSHSYDLFRKDNGWHSIKLGFDYAKIKAISVGLVGIPPKTDVNCVLENPRALSEIQAPLSNPVFEMGPARLPVSGEVNTGEYLSYAGGQTVQIRDADRKLLREVPVKADKWAAPTGRCEIGVRSDGRAPHLRLSLKPVGDGFSFANPTAEAKIAYDEITR
jgi:hypothetical protein